MSWSGDNPAGGRSTPAGAKRWLALGTVLAAGMLAFGYVAHRSFSETLTTTFTAQQALFVRSLETSIMDHMSNLEKDLRHVASDFEDPRCDIGRNIPALFRTHFDNFSALGVFEPDGTPLQLAPAAAGVHPEWLEAVRTALGERQPGEATFLSERFHDGDGKAGVALIIPFTLPTEDPKPVFAAGAARIEDYMSTHFGTWRGRSMGFVLADDNGTILSMLNTVHEIDARMRRGNLLRLGAECLTCHAASDFEDVRDAMERRTAVNSLFRLPGGDLANRATVGFPVFNEVWTVSIISPFESIQSAIDRNLRVAVALALLALLLLGTITYLVLRSLTLRRLAATAGALRISEEKLQHYSHDLEEANRIKDLFTDLVRHDLLNPVATAKGYAEVLARGERDGSRGELFAAQVRALDKLGEIIEDASTISRLSETASLKVQTLDLGAVLGAALERNLGALRSRGIEIAAPPAGNFPIVANPLLEEVFWNLLSNAVKFSPPGGRVGVELLDRGPSWEVRVRDQGDGVPEELREQAFRRHERLGKTSIKGLGLGLAIVKRIVDLHKGEVAIEDNPGGGSVFVVRLPKTGPAIPGPHRDAEMTG